MRVLLLTVVLYGLAGGSVVPGPGLSHNREPLEPFQPNHSKEVEQIEIIKAPEQTKINKAPEEIEIKKAPGPIHIKKAPVEKLSGPSPIEELLQQEVLHEHVHAEEPQIAFQKGHPPEEFQNAGAPIPVTDKDERLPPNIAEFEQVLVMASRDSTHVLPCSASGVPTPSYTWSKDGQLIDFSNNQMYSLDPDGPLTLKNLGKAHQGFYQCRAENKYGVALSLVVDVRLAYIGSYLPAEKMTKQVHVNEGDPLQLSCKPLEGYPLSYSWVETASSTSQLSNRINTGPRIVKDQNGNLYFSYVERGKDELIKTDGSHWIYKCNVKEVYTDKTVGGSYTNVTIREVPGGIQTRAPQIQYWSAGEREKPAEDEVITALEGESLLLSCIFSGNPTPIINAWSKEGGALPVDRYEHLADNSQLNLTRVLPADAGVYVCTGNNVVNKAQRKFTVIVNGKPVFEAGMDLQNVNGTVGDDTHFDCFTKADPPAQIVWLRNGQELTDGALPERMDLSDAGRRLTVRRVCKTCDTGQRRTDLMVFQCNATNKHGHAFANGYLNVLLPTRITVAPPGNVIIKFGNGSQVENIVLPCQAEADDSTPVTYTWIRNDLDLAHQPPVFTVFPNNSLHINITAVSDDEKEQYAGSYFCKASNGYSESIAEAFLEITRFEPQISSGGLSLLLIIIIICLCVVLLLVMCILCCCMYYYRNRGDEYPVDQIERKRGNDPVKELEANGYHEFQRTMDTGTLKGSRAGFGSRASLSSRRTLDDDEEGLLGDGYFGPGTFNEDGSFIGQYNTATRNKKM